MIKGIGTDIVKLIRVEQSIERFGEGFARRILHTSELARFQSHAQPVAYLAKRFAAKEALVKAFGTGFRDGIALSDIEVINDVQGKPEIVLHGRTRQFFDDNAMTSLHLTLSDEHDYAIAFVVVE